MATHIYKYDGAYISYGWFVGGNGDDGATGTTGSIAPSVSGVGGTGGSGVKGGLGETIDLTFTTDDYVDGQLDRAKWPGGYPYLVAGNGGRGGDGGSPGATAEEVYPEYKNPVLLNGETYYQTTIVHYRHSNGGIGGNAADGGAGGNAIYKVSNLDADLVQPVLGGPDPYAWDLLTATGGAGGAGGDAAGGGIGVKAYYEKLAEGDLPFNGPHYDIYGEDAGSAGGAPGLAGNGGDGGAAIFHFSFNTGWADGLRAVGGDGGAGGAGAIGGGGLIAVSYSGGGKGGRGGDAAIVFEHLEETWSWRFGTMNFEVLGGSGGRGGNAALNSLAGVGGNGGDASIVFRHNMVNGVTVLSFSIVAGFGGAGGNSGAGQEGSRGTGSLDVSDNIFTAPDGSTLNLQGINFSSSDGHGQPYYLLQDLVIDLRTGLLQIGDGVNTLVGYQNIILDSVPDRSNSSGTLHTGGTAEFTAVADLTGDDSANVFYAGNGNDTLSGQGGNDELHGQGGNDVIDGDLGTDAIDGGNGADTISGGGGDDILFGFSGADQLIGGTGNDLYLVYDQYYVQTSRWTSVTYDLKDNLEDSITELADGGVDTVLTTAVSYTLLEPMDGLGNYVENLTFQSTFGTAQDFTGTGNALDNVITGEFGNDKLYGLAGNDNLIGNLGDDTLDGGLGDDTLSAGAGADIVSGGSGSEWVYAGAGNDMLAGDAGDDSLYGEDGEDTLRGGDGNDILEGGLGADTMNGGVGNDTFVVDSTLDLVNESNGQGNDTVFAAVTWNISLAHVETLILTGSAHIDGKGNNLANVLTGNSGNNRLDGSAGADTLTGGAGNDTYMVDNAGDVVVEADGEGVDTLQTVFTTILSANLENLILSGAAAVNGTGNGSDNALFGNGGNNALTGLGGNDKLDGGLGADSLVGGLGNDTYVVDNAGDSITERSDQGTDVLLSSVSYDLGAVYVEYLTLTGSADINATGNALVNTLRGNAGNNVLDGGGSADNMYGGAGNDSYYVNHPGDRTYEKAPDGSDTGGHDVVYAAARVTLEVFVEDLIITGTVSLAGTGNALDNRIIGNIGNNSLSGKDGNDVLNGGLGADSMAGSLGDDTYYVDNAVDRVLEGNGQGNDLVYSSVNFSLGSQYVETVILTGSAAINATGNGIDNTLIGNAAANVLDGGKANDLLTGGLGADVFVFGLKSGVDRVSDFNAGEGDTIDVHAYAHGVVNGGGIAISQVGADMVIALGGSNSIVVLNTVATDPAVLSQIVW